MGDSKKIAMVLNINLYISLKNSNLFMGYSSDTFLLADKAVKIQYSMENP